MRRPKHRLRAPVIALLLALAAALPPAPIAAVDPPPQDVPHSGEIFKPHPARPAGPSSVPGGPISGQAGAVVPSGFRDELVIGGLFEPTAVQFAADGRIIVGEKSGRISIYSSPTDGSPGVYTGLMSKVFNLWDRGFLGMVIDPNFTTGRPYIYVSYTYNHILGDPDPAPKWPAGDCPDPPGFTDDGCVVSGRIDRLTVDNKTIPGGPEILVEDWCQQFPSHSMGSLAFGPEGALYATSGEGASFYTDDIGQWDFGQRGGTRLDPDDKVVTPANPCGDPNKLKGTPATRPAAEGGSLRSQDLRTPTADPVGLSGTLIRIRPEPGGAPWPGNYHIGSPSTNEQRILAYGLRNPFRFAIRPGTNEVWIGDVGNYSWEEINQVPSANAARKNFGWPCYEGDGKNGDWDALNVTICENLYADPTSVTKPAFRYGHNDAIAGESCDMSRGSAIAGITFLGTASSYPNQYDNALFFTDYNRRCIWSVPAILATGMPDFTNVHLFANLVRTDPADTDGAAVYLGTDRNGDLVYSDFDRGEIRRIRWYSSVPPTASFTATPTSGAMPLQVSFDGRGSTNPNPTDQLQYAWDLDGDGSYDDGTGPTITKTYTGSTKKTIVVRLRVTSTTPLSDATTRTIYPGYVAPNVTMGQPAATLRWNPNDVISFSASATDGSGAQIPASAFSWAMNIEHCPSACHSHPAFFVAPGVKSGTFSAPNHEYPSRIRIKLTVTDGPVSTTVVREIAMAPPIDDGSDTCLGAPAPTVPSGLWTAGRFASSGDVDWYRFSLSKTTRVRIVLGDLAVNGKLELYRGCTTLLSQVDRSGTTVEEMIINLAAGTYAIKLSGSGTPATPAYTRLIRAMPASVHVMSARSKVVGSTLTLVGEVYNNTSATRGPVTVTAKLYNSSGNVLATWTTSALPALLSATRTPFRLLGSVPPGYHHASYTVGAPATSGLVVRPTVTGVTAAPDGANRWRISGTVQNGSSSIRWLRVDLAAYDNRGEIVDTVRAAVGAATLAAHASTTFTGTFLAAGYVPIRTAVWTYALR